MILRGYIIFLLFLSSTYYLAAQSSDVKAMKFYADAMVNATDAENRVFAGAEFKKLMEVWVASPENFNNDLKEIPWISLKYDPKRTFRIITWQIKGVNDVFDHQGYIQSKNGKLETLIAATKPDADSQYEILDASNWLGTLYYGIEEVGNNYLLFGFHGGDGKEYTKLVDVLSFDKDGNAQFGKEIFRFDQGNTRPDMHSRIFVQYTPTATVSCKYDVENKMIIHDYTSSKMLGMQGSSVGKVPDGTYVAFNLKDGIWQRIDQLQNTQVELKSPDYNSKRDPKGTDILGRSKNK